MVLTKTKLHAQVDETIEKAQAVIDRKLAAKQITKKQAAELRARTLQAMKAAIDTWQYSLVSADLGISGIQDCPLCKGSGKTLVPSFKDPSQSISKSCSVCRGSGRLQGGE